MTHLRGDVIVRPENDDLDRDIRDPDVHQHLRVIHRNAAGHYEREGMPGESTLPKVAVDERLCVLLRPSPKKRASGPQE